MDMDFEHIRELHTSASVTLYSHGRNCTSIMKILFNPFLCLVFCPMMQPSDAYAGPNRVIVPTVRSTLTGGEVRSLVLFLPCAAY